MAESRLMGVDEVASYLGISKSRAYKVMRDLNDRLQRSGHMVIAGRVSRDYLDEAFFGIPRLEIGEKGGE